MTSRDNICMPVAIFKLLHRCIVRSLLLASKDSGRCLRAVTEKYYIPFYYQIMNADTLKMQLLSGYGTLCDCSSLEAEVVVASL